MSSNLTPLQVCERLIGPPEKISEACGLQAKASYGWRHPSRWRAAGDLPSAQTMRRLLAHAAARGIPLRAEHLIWGASEQDMADLGYPLPAPENETTLPGRAAA